MIECIHGLDIELCDICTPRKRDEAQELPAPARRSPVSTARAVRAPSTLRTPKVKAPSDPALPDVDLAAMRVHHWTHLTNLPAIIADGALRAVAEPELDVLSPEARTRRSEVTVPSGASVSAHVPFALTPDAASWDAVRHGAAGAEWSAAARATRATDFVVLVAPVKSVGDGFVFADGDAAAPLTRFAEGLEEGAKLARRASLADPELAQAEFLIPDAFDLAGVTLIGVPNDRARDEVKALLREYSGKAPRVAVYPPWFKPSDE
ncbi:uncharacterized protein DUF4433 [Frondihabitans sp. PhB188]|uniref:DarT ssDNA thymidine ADP-ribosyltransferase family protein n=1 Tax=Frondihabitans sp. PhB188 TaxID=2485200 RepID=UPI000F49F6FE|nr:DarT ssDNA thymidine ADP-ribosyltransferase family protein [Frondihabitans sp. PhB188]ROQ37399.1 uncharacterized protein DUF4433 [Frondihabitans sp. PhB188]